MDKRTREELERDYEIELEYQQSLGYDGTDTYYTHPGSPKNLPPAPTPKKEKWEEEIENCPSCQSGACGWHGTGY